MSTMRGSQLFDTRKVVPHDDDGRDVGPYARPAPTDPSRPCVRRHGPLSRLCLRDLALRALPDGQCGGPARRDRPERGGSPASAGPTPAAARARAAAAPGRCAPAGPACLPPAATRTAPVVTTWHGVPARWPRSGHPATRPGGPGPVPGARAAARGAVRRAAGVPAGPGTRATAVRAFRPDARPVRAEAPARLPGRTVQPGQSRAGPLVATEPSDRLPAARDASSRTCRRHLAPASVRRAGGAPAGPAPGVHRCTRGRTALVQLTRSLG